MNSYFELVDLDWNEVSNIESFVFDAINTQSGLPRKRVGPPMEFEYDGEVSDEPTEDDSFDSDDSDIYGRRSGWYRFDEM